MRSPRIVAATVIAFTGTAVLANAQAVPATYRVTLHCDNKTIAVSPAAVPRIYYWAYRDVATAQENSGGSYWEFPISEVEQEYHDALAGDYLRVDLGSVATIKTPGGVVYASAIVERLDNWHSRYADRFIDGLFTTDESGSVVGYAQYSGFIAVALSRAIKSGISDPDACTRAERLFYSTDDSRLPAFLRDWLRDHEDEANGAQVTPK